MSETGIVVHRDAAVRSRRHKRPPALVVTVKVDPDVWAEALRLAGNDVHRLVVVDQWTVLVINNPRRKR